MPWDQVMHKWKHGQLHSGNSKGPKVSDRKQAIAIMLSEKKKAAGGKEEYKSNPIKKAKKKGIKTAPANLQQIFGKSNG